jgi:hypothetical protein
MSLRSNFYQYIFFEVPFYFYMIVGYALNFSWVSLYAFLKNFSDPDVESILAKIKLILKSILVLTGVLLLAQTSFAYMI